jgi:hypothetical protein
VQAASGEVIVFLDADACPGEHLLRSHVSAQRERPGFALGEFFVVPGTETLLDPATGTRPARWAAAGEEAPAAPPVLVKEEYWQDGVDAFFAPHAVKGGYPWQQTWQMQLEELLIEGERSLSWAGVTPHNLSVPRETFIRLGGFDPFLTHSEGWDLGLRAVRAGVEVHLARGGRSYHLFHWRPRVHDMKNYQDAQWTVCERHAALVPQSVYVWLAAVLRDPSIPGELNFQNWRFVRDALRTADGRRLIVRIYEGWRDAQTGLRLAEYLAGAAINAPMSWPTLPPR